MTYGYSRFRLPLLPALLVVAAQAMVAWRDRSRLPATRGRRLLGAAVGVALALAVAPSLLHQLAGAIPEPAEEGGAAQPDTP